MLEEGGGGEAPTVLLEIYLQCNAIHVYLEVISLL